MQRSLIFRPCYCCCTRYRANDGKNYAHEIDQAVFFLPPSTSIHKLAYSTFPFTVHFFPKRGRRKTALSTPFHPSQLAACPPTPPRATVARRLVCICHTECKRFRLLDLLSFVGRPFMVEANKKSSLRITDAVNDTATQRAPGCRTRRAERAAEAAATSAAAQQSHRWALASFQRPTRLDGRGAPSSAAYRSQRRGRQSPRPRSFFGPSGACGADPLSTADVSFFSFLLLVS